LLVFVNLANAGNLLVAAFLWVHGDWIGIVHGHTVKFFFSPVFASSLQLAGLVVLVHFWGPIVSWFQDFRRRFIPMSMVWGFLAGYWPALLGTVFGHSPSSTGKYESLPETLENLSVLFRDIFPWMFRAGALPALFPYVVLIYAGGIGALLFEIYAQYKKWRDGQALALHPFVYLFIINLLVALFSLRLGNQGTARYLLPLFISLPFGIALFLERTTGRAYAVALALLGVFLFANYAAGRELLTRTPRPASLSAVASCLEAHHYPGGYADYWLAYQITALSNERVILAPTGDNDRYKPYLAYVRSLKNVILLGETPQPLRSLVTVKGVPYRVIAADSCSGVPVMMMEKAT
jgi:hypothetical protein